MFIKLPKWAVTTIEKINVAWKIEYVEYNYNKTCEACASKGLCNHCDCDKCALKIAHDRAIKEINAGLRIPPERTKRGCYVANNLQRTEVLHCYDETLAVRTRKRIVQAETVDALQKIRLEHCRSCKFFPNCENCKIHEAYRNRLHELI